MLASKGSWRIAHEATGLVFAPMRGFRKTAAPGHYNLRFKPSQGIDNIYVQYWANIHSADGHEQAKTQRNPTKFNWSNNLFKNDFWEWRMRAADYLY
jgi:hypothetical protein